MFNKFLQGLVYGSGFAIAFVVIWAIGLVYVLPAAIERSNKKTPDMSGASTESVVPITESTKLNREFKLHKDSEYDRKIPKNGGMLSIAILEEDSGKERPNSFQAWVTETKAFVISTEGDVPNIKEVPYETIETVDYASKLVRDNVGFRKQNSSMPISETEITRLASGKPSSRDNYVNGKLRATKNGVIFFLPNKYEHNKVIQPTAESGD